jgi:hypothetical protein
MRSVFVVCALALLVVCPQIATADDFAPPWYRGQPLSVYAAWDFVPPPGSFVAGWDAETEIVTGGSAGEVLRKFGTRTSHIDFDMASNWTWDGVTNIAPVVTPGASLAVNMVNWIDQMPYKLLRIQVTYIGQAPPDIMVPLVAGFEGPLNELTYPGSLVQRVDVDPNHFFVDWRIIPNPDWEQILIHVPIGNWINQIVVDTVSIPEPATVGLLLLALVGMGAARKRG